MSLEDYLEQILYYYYKEMKEIDNTLEGDEQEAARIRKAEQVKTAILLELKEKYDA